MYLRISEFAFFQGSLRKHFLQKAHFSVNIFTLLILVSIWVSTEISQCIFGFLHSHFFPLAPITRKTDQPRFKFKWISSLSGQMNDNTAFTKLLSANKASVTKKANTIHSARSVWHNIQSSSIMVTLSTQWRHIH